MAAVGYGPAERKQERDCPWWIRWLRACGVDHPWRAWLRAHPIMEYWD
jgi:hypothetical protein